MRNEETLVRLEVICGIFWMLSDGSWLMEWANANFAAGAIAISVAVATFFYQEWKPVPLLVCGADFCWLLMNVLWSIGDLAEPKIPELIFLAKVLFFAGLACISCAFWNCKVRKDAFQLVLRRVRVLRVLRSMR